MKAARPGTDQELELAIFADGRKLPEYVLPGASAHTNIVECVVPVESGQRLTVHGRFEGTTLAASFDLVVDGSFLDDQRIKEQGIRRHVGRNLKFERAYDCPVTKEGWTSKMQPPLDVYESRMFVEALQDGRITLDRIEKPSATVERAGVGSIQIVANLQDSIDETYNEPEWDIEGGGWLHRYQKPVRASGIKPDHAVEVRHISLNAIPQKRSKIHRNRWNVEPRFGIEPWARFIFYYRSQKSIDRAGCVLRENHLHQLEPFTGSHQSVRSAVKICDPVEDDKLGDTSQSITSPAREHSPSSMPKLKRLGGDLGLQLRKHQKASRPSYLPQDGPSTNTAGPPADEIKALVFGDTTTNLRHHGQDCSVQKTRNEVTAKYEFTRAPNGLGQNSLQARGPDRNKFLNKLTLNQDASSRAQPAAVSFTPSTRLSPKSSTSALHPPHLTTASRLRNPMNMAKQDYQRHLTKVPSREEIIQLIGPEGISQPELNTYFDDIAKAEAWHRDKSPYARLRTEFNNRVQQVADASRLKVTLKERYLFDATAAEAAQQAPAPVATMSATQADRSLNTRKPSPLLKRPLSKSGTPDSNVSTTTAPPNKKPKLNTATNPISKASTNAQALEIESRRQKLVLQRQQTEELFRQVELKRAEKREKQARKERAREAKKEKERQARLEREREELELLREEEEVGEMQRRAVEELMGLEGDDGDEDGSGSEGDGEDAEGEAQEEGNMGDWRGGEGEGKTGVESEEE